MTTGRPSGRHEVLTRPQMTLGRLSFMGHEDLAGNVVPAGALDSVRCIASHVVTCEPAFSLRNRAQLAQMHLAQLAPPSRAEGPAGGGAREAVGVVFSHALSVGERARREASHPARECCD